MDNNKSLLETDDKTNAELRKMFPRDGADIGIVNEQKLNAHATGKKYTKRSKLSHNK